MKNIIEGLIKQTNKNPNKIIFGDESREITYFEFLNLTKKLATKILEKNITKKPIAIYMDKNIECLNAMFSVAYTNNFYTVIDSSTPID